jgi:hypothetical protein
MVGVEGMERPRAKQFDDCLRRCEQCGIGASNAISNPTYIYKAALQNIPEESREGASYALSQALNERNRKTKELRFGFSTSEDAVTWVVFTYLLHSGHLLDTLGRSGLIPHTSMTSTPALLLWGVPIDRSGRGLEIRSKLQKICASLRERRNSFSEPDVIVDAGEDGLLFIEAKYRGKNDYKQPEYRGWSKYQVASRLTWWFDDVRASGCYELARNWCLLKHLARDRPATLANLGSADLFAASRGRLERFDAALNEDHGSRFVTITWSDLLGDGFDDMPSWFVEFCRNRKLTAW